MMVPVGGLSRHAIFMPKGHFLRTPEHRANIGKALKGRTVSEATRAIQSAQRKGRKASDEARRKMSATRKGKPSGRVFTPEMAENMSRARKGKSGKLSRYGISNEEYVERIKAGEKWCVFRKHFATIANFPPKSHHSSVCSACTREYQRHSNLRGKFGVDGEWYMAKLAEQSGGCGICRSTEVKGNGKKHFGVDHSHSNGQVRGLLCFRCNAALERIESIPGWSDAAAAYLSRYAVQDDGAPIHIDHRPKQNYTRKKINSGGIV